MREAILALDKSPLKLVEVSSLQETDPVGDGFSQRFVNAVAWIQTPLSPVPLMDHLLAIETRFGRDRTLGPDRTLDLDLLLMRDVSGNWIRSTSPDIPHPRMFERSFVLHPLREVFHYTWPAEADQHMSMLQP